MVASARSSLTSTGGVVIRSADFLLPKVRGVKSGETTGRWRARNTAVARGAQTEQTLSRRTHLRNALTLAINARQSP